LDAEFGVQVGRTNKDIDLEIQFIVGPSFKRYKPRRVPVYEQDILLWKKKKTSLMTNLLSPLKARKLKPSKR